MRADFSSAHLPSLNDLGVDLLRTTRWQRVRTLATPFLCFVVYAAFAAAGWWTPAILSLFALNFLTYGSTSHDLVHRNLGLPRRCNDVWLCVIELLALRSGHAYQAAHLHHHARFPHADDIEGAAAHKSWLGALAEGPTLQLRMWCWALRNARGNRAWILAEGIAAALVIGSAMLLAFKLPACGIYAAGMIVTRWLFPFALAYLPHDPKGENELTQTRAFRGKVAFVLALQHLYHLEHHLYPGVPHCNWPRLARRLDRAFMQVGVVPVRVWF